MPTKYAEFLGMQGTGRTVAEARADAARQVEALAREICTPQIIKAHHAAYAGMIYRNAAGWTSAIIMTPKEGLRENFGSTGAPTREQLERSLRRHLADLATDWRTCQTAEDVDPVCQNEEDRKDIARGSEWQRRMRRAMDAGLDEHNARAFVDGFHQHMTQAIPAALATA